MLFADIHITYCVSCSLVPYSASCFAHCGKSITGKKMENRSSLIYVHNKADVSISVVCENVVLCNVSHLQEYTSSQSRKPHLYAVNYGLYCKNIHSWLAKCFKLYFEARYKFSFLIRISYYIHNCNFLSYL